MQKNCVLWCILTLLVKNVSFTFSFSKKVSFTFFIFQKSEFHCFHFLKTWVSFFSFSKNMNSLFSFTKNMNSPFPYMGDMTLRELQGMWHRARHPPGSHRCSGQLAHRLCLGGLLSQWVSGVAWPLLRWPRQIQSRTHQIPFAQRLLTPGSRPCSDICSGLVAALWDKAEGPLGLICKTC